MQPLSDVQERCLRELLAALIDQRAARVLVPPYEKAMGFWFGGGSLALGDVGTIWLSGRYRNYGDSRTGLKAGERGLECALFRSGDGGQTFEKACSWSKADLSREGRTVLSIEGTALHKRPDGTWELYVSSEKDLAYPGPVRALQKPGTGVWTIDRLVGPSPDELDLCTLEPVLENVHYPPYLHVKDPVVFGMPDGGTAMVFCSHPFCWSSTNTGLAVRRAGEQTYAVQAWEVVSRGATWDVAATRITDRLPVPQVGCFGGEGACSVYFYDGAECLRPLEENPLAQRRPRGYSCEEIGGAFWGRDAAFPAMTRLSVLQAMFVSPWGTGCSRYVCTLVSEAGILATWQQGQADGSQPLVGRFLPMGEVGRILGDRWAGDHE
jgi:hypothetical protein